MAPTTDTQKMAVAEQSRNITDGLRMLRREEQLFGGPFLDQPAVKEQGGPVADAGGLGKIVRHHDHGEPVGERSNELFDLLGRGRVQRGGGLVEQQDLRVHRKRTGQAQQLLLTTREPEWRIAEPILDRIPEADLGQACLRNALECPCAAPVYARARPATTLSKIDIGNGLGRWNSMPTLRRNSIRSWLLKMLSPPNRTSPL